MYLEFHDVSTGWSAHQARPNILGVFVQFAHISWVLIVIHHLQTEKQTVWGKKTMLQSGFRQIVEIIPQD